jgi:hypothetical protein
MQCTCCGYPLWNLAKRQCPECGQIFSINHYFYRAGTVRFLCPHCRLEQPPRNSRGQPTDARPCAGCGRDAAVDEMIVEPVNPDRPFPAFPVAVDTPQRRERRKRDYRVAVAIIVIAVAMWLGSSFFPLIMAFLF